MDNFYLKKYGFKEPQIKADAPHELGIIVVIPCYNEPDLISSLQSLLNCDLPKCVVEVITVINASENSSAAIIDQNEKTYKKSVEWAEQNNQPRLQFHFIEENRLLKKHAGVGLARKIGMDEAVARFHSIGNNKGIIVCFDADSLCSNNYLTEIERHFSEHKTPGCSIYFEHPLEGEQSQEIYRAITEYELFLRYYKNGLQYAGLPFAYHTVGSSMAVTSQAYQKQGGMNRRKSGEDFYFVNKIIELGGFTELNSTTVIPSPRISDRVPFGTGKAVGELVQKNGESFKTYNPQTFEDLNQLVGLVKESKPIQDLSEAVHAYLTTIGFEENYQRIKDGTNSDQAFQKRFFHWFDAFKVLKFVHFARDNYYSEIPIIEAAGVLLHKLEVEVKLISSNDLLLLYRDLDKKKSQY